MSSSEARKTTCANDKRTQRTPNSEQRTVVIGSWPKGARKAALEEEGRTVLRGIRRIVDVWVPARRCSVIEAKLDTIDSACRGEVSNRQGFSP